MIKIFCNKNTAKAKAALLTFVIIAFYLFSAKGQVVVQDFSSRVKTYQDQNPLEMVYLQTDREVYSDGDHLNFKAYIRDIYNPTAISASSNLHVILVDTYGATQQEKIFKIINNQAEGMLDILYGLPKGEYFLIAWTNMMESGRPEKVFKKKIFINSRILPEVFIKLSAGNSTYLPGDIAQIKVEILNMEGQPLKRKKISYIASYNGSSFEAKDAKTDKEGKASLDLTLPENEEMGLVVVEAAVQHDGNTFANSILVQTSKTPIWIDFAPEGGLFVDGFDTQFGFRAYDYLGNTVDIEGQILDKDNKQVKEISSSMQGFGSFTAKADIGNPLKVRLTKPSGIDIDFHLPEVHENGIQLILKNRSPESLDFLVNTDIEDSSIPLHAVAVANGNLLLEKRFNLNVNSEFSVPIQLIQYPQVVKVNILNRAGDILAHRSVFLPGQNPAVLLSSSEETKSGHDGGTLDLRLDNLNGQSQTYLSASSTDHIMAPEWAPVQDIMSWFLLGPTASYAAFPVGYLTNPGEDDLEIIDHYMLFQMDNDLDWANIKSGKKTDSKKSKDEFRDELKNFYQTSDFEKLITQIRTSLFFNKYFLETDNDFIAYLSDNKNKLEELGYFPVQLNSDEKIQQQLASGKSIMSVLMTIKPYKMMGNNIVFRGNDSFNNQGSVLIVIDGVSRGSDSNVLNSISPFDVETIKASANIADIQKYSGLNSTGVIEITTKKGNNKPVNIPTEIIQHPTIYWEPSISPEENGSLSLKIPRSPLKTVIKTSVQGIDANGNLLVWTSKK